jgi:two-component system heavy metal sensor histidine kinase CusS
LKWTLRTRLALSFAAAVAGALLVFSAVVVAVFSGSELSDTGEREIGENTWRVLISMALAAPAAVGGAAGLGLWLARRAVAPLQEASARARAARSSELDLTLPVRGAGDEWDELAVTLNALLVDARGSMERIRRFTADAAHELRTPLTAILGEAEVALRRERSAGELRASLGVVHEEAARLAAVLDALLTLSRADAGTLLSTAMPSLFLEEAAREAADLALADARRLGLTGGSIDISGVAGPVRGERVLLVRALRNLFENGLRHGGGKVEVRLSTDGPRALVRIADRGPGVPDALRPLLFQRFARADEARSGGGLGLGLAIARAIAEAHGGALELIASERGAAFELAVPSDSLRTVGRPS